MTPEELNAARDAAAAICAAKLVGKGYTTEQIATIAFHQGAVHGIKETYALIESKPTGHSQ